jgi:hypothetical protein
MALMAEGLYCVIGWLLPAEEDDDDMLLLYAAGPGPEL